MQSAFAAESQKPLGPRDSAGEVDLTRTTSLSRHGSMERSQSLERARWRNAITRVSRANSFSRSFKTLRDMTGESYVPPERLKFIKQLGTGAFATVHLAELSPESGEGPKTKEFLDGGTLKKKVLAAMMAVRGKPPYSNAQALKWVFQVAEGLNYLHTAHPCVIHRDLKLENIVCKKLPNGEEQMCLCDFGLSVLVRVRERGVKSRLEDSAREYNAAGDTSSVRQLSEELSARLLEYSLSGGRGRRSLRSLNSKGPEAPTFNLTGKTGSFFYMAPETVLCQPSNEKVDVFAFAIVMFEVFSYTMTSAIVCGPTQAPHTAEVYALKVARGYRRPLLEHWPEALQHLIEDCWAEQPSKRPSMAACVQRLKEMQAHDFFAPGSQQGASGQGCACSIM
ncbi:hypothetical protein WJX73_005204 [Symbiochloris irregularis]|uniref:Protein kinase domain-containing protein n=2 Tax=Symbiochloris irregularis TaxID=706552 RepID=A0AAW1NMK7_9CHLO